MKFKITLNEALISTAQQNKIGIPLEKLRAGDYFTYTNLLLRYVRLDKKKERLNMIVDYIEPIKFKVSMSEAFFNSDNLKYSYYIGDLKPSAFKKNDIILNKNYSNLRQDLNKNIKITKVEFDYKTGQYLYDFTPVEEKLKNLKQKAVPESDLV